MMHFTFQLHWGYSELVLMDTFHQLRWWNNVFNHPKWPSKVVFNHIHIMGSVSYLQLIHNSKKKIPPPPPLPNSKLSTKKTITPSNSDPYHPSVRCHPKCLMKHGHGPNPSKRGFQDLHPHNHFLQEMCPKRAKQKGQIRSLDSKSFFEKGCWRCLFRKSPFETSPRCCFDVKRKNGRFQRPQSEKKNTAFPH